MSPNLQDSEGALRFMHDGYTYRINEPLKIAAMKAKVLVHVYVCACVQVLAYIVVHVLLVELASVWVHECDLKNESFAWRLLFNPWGFVSPGNHV